MLGPALAARLAFLSRVTDKECHHLLETDRRLFSNLALMNFKWVAQHEY